MKVLFIGGTGNISTACSKLAMEKGFEVYLLNRGNIDQAWMWGNLLGDKAVSTIFDNTKIKTFVPDFKATIPFKQGIKRTVEWFDADPSRIHINEGNNDILDNVIEAYSKDIVRFQSNENYLICK